MLTVTVQAQNEDKGKHNSQYWEKGTFSTIRKGSALSFAGGLWSNNPSYLSCFYPLCGFRQWNLVADKVKDAENVLRVKAAKTDFTDSTNLSVITQDGGFYSFEVSYHTTPQPLTIDFGRGMPQGNNVKSDILFSDTGWESPAVAQIIMSSIYHQKKNYIKHIGSENAGIQWLLKGIYVHNSKLYVDVQLSNRSNLPFE